MKNIILNLGKLNFFYLFKKLFENKNSDIVSSFTAFGILVTPFYILSQ